MAKIFYLLKKNMIKSNKSYGKYYARSKTIEVMNTRKMAQHISEHGSIYTPDVVFGVLEKFRSCLIEMLLSSRRVKIDGLGIFFTTLENAKGGIMKKEDFNPQKHLKGLHIRFLPDQVAETNISSREFLKKAEFVNAESMVGLADEDDNPTGGNTGGYSGGGNTGGGYSGGDYPEGPTGD